MGTNNTGPALEDPQEWLRLCHVVMAIVICILGFLANILGFVVFIDMEMRAPITILMTGLAICNAVTLMFYIPFAMLLWNINSKHGHQSVYAYTAMTFFAHAFMTTSAICNWLTVTIAVYMLAVVQGICHPLKRMATSRARHINYLVYILVTILCAPNFYDDFTIPHDRHPNVTVWTLGAGYVTGSSSLLTDFNIVVNSVVMRIIPSVILTMVVFVVVKDMRTAVRVSRHIHTDDNKEVTRWNSNRVQTLIITRTLLTVLVIFTVTESSNGVLMLLAYRSPGVCVLYTKIGHVLATLALINYAVIFLLYSFMSYQFREACKQASCHQPRPEFY